MSEAATWAMYDAMCAALRLTATGCRRPCEHGSCRGWRDLAAEGLRTARVAHKAGQRSVALIMTVGHTLQAEFYREISDLDRPATPADQASDFSRVFMPMATALVTAAQAARATAGAVP